MLQQAGALLGALPPTFSAGVPQNLPCPSQTHPLPDGPNRGLWTAAVQQPRGRGKWDSGRGPRLSGEAAVRRALCSGLSCAALGQHGSACTLLASEGGQDREMGASTCSSTQYGVPGRNQGRLPRPHCPRPQLKSCLWGMQLSTRLWKPVAGLRGPQDPCPAPRQRVRVRAGLVGAAVMLGSSAGTLGAPAIGSMLHVSLPGLDALQSTGGVAVQLASAGPDIALGPGVVAKVLDGLGVDALALLATTVLVVPTCKFVKVSPILGFLGAGVVLNQLGFFQNVDEIAAVSELGILFLLFQMGLELSLDRLRELAKFAFGLGLTQMLLCTLVFAAVGVPADSPLSPSHLLAPLFSLASSLGTLLPTHLAGLAWPACPQELQALLSSVTLDEDVIIALALSLSSSAFVLNLLSEQGELGTRHGSATLGVLLLQDIAVVPLLAVLPVLEGGFSSAAASVAAATTVATTAAPIAAALPAVAAAGSAAGFLPALQAHVWSSGVDLGLLPNALAVATSSPVAANGADLMQGLHASVAPLVAADGLPLALPSGSWAVAQQLLLGSGKALAGLGAMLLGGQLLMKPAFRVVKQSQSPEAFMALSLLAVTGTAMASAKLGFSDSLGAFLAGAILSSSNLKHEVQQYTAPFEKLLLGLFFITTGSSIDLGLLVDSYPSILWLLGGLLLVKTVTIALIGPRFGLTASESVRTAFLLSQGGEFAFVVLALAKELGVLPEEVNRVLIIVVVLSMALTPLLNEIGKAAAAALELVSLSSAHEGVEASTGKLEGSSLSGAAGKQDLLSRSDELTRLEMSHRAPSEAPGPTSKRDAAEMCTDLMAHLYDYEAEVEPEHAGRMIRKSLAGKKEVLLIDGKGQESGSNGGTVQQADCAQSVSALGEHGGVRRDSDRIKQ